MSMRNFITLVESAFLAEAPRSKITPDEFIAMAKKEFPDVNKQRILSRRDLDTVALKNGIPLPSIFITQKAKWASSLDPKKWDFSGQAYSAQVSNDDIEADTGGEVEQAPETPRDEDEALLRRAQSLRKMVNKGLVTILGRSANGGKFVRLPGAEELAAQLERMMARTLAGNGDNTMEEQYNDLVENVELIASGKSDYLKSLLITGAPSSGKTYTVMKTIKEIGLKENVDYVTKKGRITVPQMYKVLIAQTNGLTIFDDCDSVVEDKNGVNMLKGALDTDPVREVSYDTARTVDTASLSEDERLEYTDALSRIFRFKQTPDDLSFMHNILTKMSLHKKALKSGGVKSGGKGNDEEISSEEDDGTAAEDVAPEEYQESEEDTAIINFVKNNLPNKIVYKGRIIFISNLDEDEWDSAILTRAFRTNMTFRDDEMLDFIDKIKDKIPKPNGDALTQQDLVERQEAWDFVRDLYHSGKLKSPVNFRLAMLSFDIRKIPTWQRMLSKM